jgi:hypothetical protein
MELDYHARPQPARAKGNRGTGQDNPVTPDLNILSFILF